MNFIEKHYFNDSCLKRLILIVLFQSRSQVDRNLHDFLESFFEVPNVYL
jgi:hypothetical protein